jgi:hypothetical protein
MNSTKDYQDGLDGENLACKPGNIAEGLEFVCNNGMPLLGSWYLLLGLHDLFLLYISRRNRLLCAKRSQDATYVPTSPQNAPKPHPESDTKGIFSPGEKFYLSGGVVGISTSLVFFVYGFGTMYPTTHIRGLIGDGMGK